MSFSILYNQAGNPAHNLFSIAAYTDGFAKGLGLDKLEIDPQAFSQLVGALGTPSFPHVGRVFFPV